MLYIASANNGGNGAKGFIRKDRHLRGHIGQDSRFVKVTLPLTRPSANQDFGPLFDRLLHLLIERITQVFASQGTELCAIFEWIPHLQLCRVGDKFLFKSLRDRFHYDETLGSDTTLTIILEAGCDKIGRAQSELQSLTNLVCRL